MLAGPVTILNWSFVRDDIARSLTCRQIALAIGKRLDDRQLWINPDCGLKTRKWEEVRSALVNMVAAAAELRRAVL